MALTTKEICKRYCDSKWQTSRDFYEYNVAKKEFDDWLEKLYKEIKAETMKEFLRESPEAKPKFFTTSICRNASTLPYILRKINDN